MFVLEDSFFSKACEIILLFFHIRNPLFLFFDWTTKERRRRRRGFFLHFFRCDAFVFLCYLRIRGIFVFFGSSKRAAVSKKTKTKKKNEKKRGVFLGPLFAQKKPKQQHNTRCFPIQSRPHLIIVQKEGQTTNFNSLEKRRREGDGVRVSA